MWVRTCPANDECDAAGGGQLKFLKWGAITTAAQGECGVQGGNCSTQGSGSNCPWCCNDMWGIVDGNPQKWVGYLGAADFRLSAGSVVTSDRILVHWVSDKAQTGCHHTLLPVCLHQAHGCALPGPDIPPNPGPMYVAQLSPAEF